MSHARKGRAGISYTARGIVFIGTPHGGSAMAGTGAFFSTLWTTVTGQTCTTSKDQLRVMSTTLTTITKDFVDYASDLKIVSFHESRLTIPWLPMVSRPSPCLMHKWPPTLMHTVSSWSTRLRQE